MPTRPKTHSQRQREARPTVGSSYDDGRGSAAERGYNWRWQKASKGFLRSNQLCLYCTRQKRTSAATLVDHNPPHQGDMVKFWDVKTWTPCCGSCHAYVTPTYDGGGGNRTKPRDGVYVAPKPGEVTL